jgi:hypothetical protein
MIDQFESIIYELFKTNEEEKSFSIFDPTEQFEEYKDDHINIAKTLNAAFLIILAGKRHRASKRANNFIKRMTASLKWADLANFYLTGKDTILQEIETVCEKDPDFANRLGALSKWLSNKENSDSAEETNERIWSVFFPEATGIFGERQERIKRLRAKRTVTITKPNASPLVEPGRQLLFTSNVLLTIPKESMPLDELDFSSDLKEKLFQAACEPQIYWYDHPIQIGVKPDQNEVLYGLRGLEQTVEFERARGNMSGKRITCVFSVSVTHRGLQGLARKYLEEEISRSQGFNNIDLYVFTEADTTLIVEEILVPAAEHYLKHDGAKELLDVFGVDGEYGRHYSFLKAISAFWKVLIKSEIKATFKFDLDQVFPQKELVNQSKASAFEHFSTPLWGAHGIDSEGQPVELGMIAGTLVNKGDIGKSLFTPDVVFPDSTLSLEENVFFSRLPQALSTEGELMMRYITEDGKKTCIQRIHVTGGTNGILVDSLCRYRPFTPSFVGRAEDQAYILSVLLKPGEKLAYFHEDGLIMRHDKESFAQDAIEAASSAKLIGDYTRILCFSEYAKALNKNISRLKDVVDPFTGCFISKIPTTVVLIRFCLKAASFFIAVEDKKGAEFITKGAPRIANILKFVRGKNSLLKQRYEQERLGWDLYYDVLSTLEEALNNNDHFALKLGKKAKNIIRHCSIPTTSA